MPVWKWLLQSPSTPSRVSLKSPKVFPNFFNAIIVLSIVTTLPVPNLVRFIIEKCKLNFSDVDGEEPYIVPSSTDQDELI